jgi:hypothetical protein
VAVSCTAVPDLEFGVVYSEEPAVLFDRCRLLKSRTMIGWSVRGRSSRSVITDRDARLDAGDSFTRHLLELLA